MQRRIRPLKLQENQYGTLYPKPTVHSIDMSTLDGGLNLWELDYRLDPNQSPELVNVYWKDGCLRSRPGQAYVHQETGDNDFVACYERPWHDYIIVHKGTHLYKMNPTSGVETELGSNYTLTEDTGAGFFVFNNTLYYFGGGKYTQITSSFVVSEVVPFVPTVTMNRTPAGTGGNSYQPENRLAAGKKVLFTSDGTSTRYHLPYKNLDVTTVTARVLEYDAQTQTYNWVTKIESTDFIVNRTNGTLDFNVAPAQQDPETANNVEVTCYKTDAAAKAAIMNCTCLCVYGGDTDLAVVLGGSSNQPNAYFWSGNTDIDLDPTYFPVDYYNYAGSDANNAITALARQQGLLIIFQERGVGKTQFETKTIDSRDYLNLPYTGINSFIGCDVPNSVQLITNNLVFANTYGGVYVLADSSAANENNVRRLSRNVNGSSRGLLIDLSLSGDVTSFDDNERYWLIVRGNAYVFDYTIRGLGYKEESLAWFYFTGINAAGCYEVDGESFYFKRDGSSVKFTPNSFNDFGNAYLRKYVFATQFFGTYEALKDVMKIVLAVRSDTNSQINLSYKTDYETRADRTPILVSSPTYSWVPRNLATRVLGATAFAYATVRKPLTHHVRHLGLTLTNDAVNTDLGLISAQIFYRYVREIR